MKNKQQTKILEMKEKSAKAKGKKDADFHKMNERQNFASDETKTNKMLLTPAMFFVAFKTALDNFLSNTTDFRYQEELFKLQMQYLEAENTPQFSLGDISEKEDYKQ